MTGSEPSDAACGHATTKPVDELSPRPWSSDSPLRQRDITASMSPGRLQPSPSPSSLVPSPKRRRLEAIDAHKDHSDSRPLSEQRGFTSLPVIRLNEETTSPPTAPVGSAVSQEDVDDINKPNYPPASPVTADDDTRPDVSCRPETDEKTPPSTDDTQQ